MSTNSTNYKILLVDDNRIIRHLLRLTFSNHDLYQVFDADCAETAIPIILGECPDLIVMDIMMPGKLNGVELCRMIKTWKDHQNCKIIMLTACGQEDDLKVGMAAGADLYLIKPFSPRKLLASVEALLVNKCT